MSERALATPSRKEYNKEKIHVGKEVLESLISEVNNLPTAEVVERLNKHKETKPGIDKNSNTFEMIALYQKSLQLLGSEKVGKVDALFGGSTYRELKDIQEKKLGLKGKDIDGLPGPTTTKALIEVLKSKFPKPVEKPIQAKPNESPIELTNEEKAIEYLVKKEKYIEKEKGVYINPDKDMEITIKDGKVEATRILGLRLFGSWDFNDQESLIVGNVEKILQSTKQVKK